MADCTAVYIRHNLDTSSLENLKKDLEKRLHVKIDLYFELSDMDDPPQFEDSGAEYRLEIYPQPEDFYMGLCCKSSLKSLFLSRYYIEVQAYCVDLLGEWWSVPYWLDDNYKNREEYYQERKVIYEVAQLFGADECVMMNGEWLEELADKFEDGIPLEDAIKQFEEKYPTRKIPKYGYYSHLKEYVEVPRKIHVISPHENVEGKKYLYSDGWYDTIIIDDFRDFKNKINAPV